MERTERKLRKRERESKDLLSAKEKKASEAFDRRPAVIWVCQPRGRTPGESALPDRYVHYRIDADKPVAVATRIVLSQWRLAARSGWVVRG